ncbi:hypothetical protein ACH9EU_00615 [Kocuria sp. M1R5S2]|uniref:hypothetical protein n=1 Tax=Kocuria rhizosphaerae TaxID=3376285 RepID=UPI00379A9881
MAGSKNDDTLIGCGGLIALGIVLSVVAFVLEHWEVLLGAAVVAGAVTLAVRAVKARRRRTLGRQRARAESAAQVRRGRDEARRAGVEDMRTAWIAWQLRSDLPPQSIRPPAAVRERLAEVPKAEWDVSRLRAHGRSVWALRDVARPTALHREVEERLDRMAAMISDWNDQEFDTRLGQTSDEYLYHPDREIRAAYLEGGAEGVEAVIDAITAARARAREDAATRAAADALAQQRNAALRALRETQQSTEARDAHAAWDEQARKLEE